MRKGLNWMDRCSLFENIAKDVWNRIAYAHDVKMDLPEIGITSDIIVDILHFSKTHKGIFDVYAKSGFQEKTYGSDVDVFVEVESNKYIWYALQAKVLKKNGKYDTLRDTSDSQMQWDKLALLESLTGCKAYYLFYNGVRSFSHKGKDVCTRSFLESQFGCSLVEPGIIKNLADKQNAKGFISPSFKDVHPINAQPWRILTCCKSNEGAFKLYSKGQILKSNSKYKKIKSIINEEDAFDAEDTGNLSRKELEINGNVKEANWHPKFRIFISKEK